MNVLIAGFDWQESKRLIFFSFCAFLVSAFIIFSVHLDRSVFSVETCDFFLQSVGESAHVRTGQRQRPRVVRSHATADEEHLVDGRQSAPVLPRPQAEQGGSLLSVTSAQLNAAHCYLVAVNLRALSSRKIARTRTGRSTTDSTLRAHPITTHYFT